MVAQLRIRYPIETVEFTKPSTCDGPLANGAMNDALKDRRILACSHRLKKKAVMHCYSLESKWIWIWTSAEMIIQ
jgi:hypothetical protein